LVAATGRAVKPEDAVSVLSAKFVDKESSSAESFHYAVAEKLPDSIREALSPLVDQIGEISQRIRMSEQKYPETERLRQVRAGCEVAGRRSPARNLGLN
jgi:hypothetical protein